MGIYVRFYLFYAMREIPTKRRERTVPFMGTFRMRGFIYVLRHLSFYACMESKKSRRATHLASEDEERASCVCTGIRCFPSFGCFLLAPLAWFAM